MDIRMEGGGGGDGGVVTLLVLAAEPAGYSSLSYSC